MCYHPSHTAVYKVSVVGVTYFAVRPAIDSPFPSSSWSPQANC